MNQINNSIISKAFLKTLFFIQNRHHRHGVLLHTMRVCYYTIKAGEFKMIPSALLHDIGKPLVAYQKEEDIVLGEYSFSDHEERSYEIIKEWSFISDYTKQMVRYHYLIRDIAKHKSKNPTRYQRKKEIWESLSAQMQDDLRKFLSYDDLGKGKRR